jgi:DNA invertase Pin-like site-specific DNA recombinase
MVSASGDAVCVAPGLPDFGSESAAVGHGQAAAAANGRKGGRPRKVDDADAAKARQLREKGITATDIAKMLGVSRATVYRYLSDDTAA